MANRGTHRVRCQRIRDLMRENNVGVADLVRATGLTRRGIQNILDGVSDPREDNLILIASALGVRWATLVDGYDPPAQQVVDGQLAVRTTTDIFLDVSNPDAIEQQLQFLVATIRPRISHTDRFNITLVKGAGT